MKEFFKNLVKMTGFKAGLAFVLVVVPIWTWKWSKDDGQFNITMVICGVCLLAVIAIGEFISKLVKEWRAGKRQ